jgi:KGK domain
MHNIFNPYQIMNDRAKQIIPDSQSVVRCLDPEILEILDSHGTFVLSELLEMLRESSIDTVDKIAPTVFIDKLTNISEEVAQRGYSKEYLAAKVLSFIKNSGFYPNQGNLKISDAFLSGVNCNLLQPDGKGWQKGKLKVCFEFIPEEPDPLATQEKLTETHFSPLDEIRNSLIESN